MKESLYSSEPNRVIWRLTGNSEQECYKSGGVPSGAVSFIDGEAVFTTDGKITVSKTIRAIKSIRLIVNLDTTTEDILNLSSSHSIEVGTGTLTATGVTAPTIYINGTAGSTIGTGKTEIAVTTATAFDADDIILGYISAYLEGKIDYCEFWNYSLTAEEIWNMYSGKRFRAFTSSDEVLNVSAYIGSVVSKYDEPTITDIDYVKSGELYAMKFNAATTNIDLGLISDSLIGDMTAIAWIKPYAVGEGGAGRIVSNGKFIFSLTSNFTKQVFISSDNGATWKYSANDIWEIDRWSHVIVTRTAAGVTNIYKNLVLSGAADESSGTPAAPTEKTIVGNSYTGGNTIDGLLGEVRVFKRILTAYERDQIFQQERHLYNV